MIVFTVYGEAKPAGSKKAFTHPTTGRAIITDASGIEGKKWRNDVRQAARAAMGPDAPLLDGPLMVSMRFYRPRPKGHYGTGANAQTVKASSPSYPITRPDLLKLARGVEDSCTSVIWRDDSQIVDEHLVKCYGEPARVEVFIATAEEQERHLKLTPTKALEQAA